MMAELCHSPAGRPMAHDLRAVLGAIGYVTRYGIEWRAMPVDFPSGEAVYAFFERWNRWNAPRDSSCCFAGGLSARHPIPAGDDPAPQRPINKQQPDHLPTGSKRCGTSCR
jgi:hypothetical protein